jgi:hypothetical protein
MGRRIKTVVAAAAISLAVHTGLICSPTISSWLNKPKISEQVLHEEIASQKSKPDVKKLKEEREKYVSELLETLGKGGRIRLSDFFIKSEILEQNIALAEKGESLLDEKKIKRDYLELVEMAKKSVDGKENELQALHEFLHNEHYAGYYWDSGSILDAIEVGWYNCASSTKLYTALIEDVIGRRDGKIIVFGDHLMTFVGGQTIENTANGWKDAYAKYDGCGLIAPGEIFVAAYLSINKVAPEDLPRRLSHFYTSERSWPEKCSGKAAKGPGGESLLSYGVFPGVGINKGGDIPDNFIPEDGDSISAKKIVKMAELLFAVSKLEQSGKQQAQPLGESSDMENFVPIPGKAENYIELWQRFNSSFREVHEKWDPIPMRGRNCSMPLGRIPQSTVLGIIHSLSSKEKPSHKMYSRESICQKFKEELEDSENRKISVYTSLASYCKEIGDFLRNKCAGITHEDDSACGYSPYKALISMESPENFGFFLKHAMMKPKPAHYLSFDGLVRSNFQEGCRVLHGMEPKTALVRIVLQLECGDKEMIWKDLEECQKGKEEIIMSSPGPLFTLIDGRQLSKEQYGIIKRLGSYFPIYDEDGEYSDSELPMPQIARILYEYGDKKTAEEYLRKYLSGIPGRPELSLYICGVPNEFIPLLLRAMEPPYTVHREYNAMKVASLIFESGERPKYEPQFSQSLRMMVSSPEFSASARVNAAMLLLKMGIDPAGPSQKAD